MKRMGAFLLTIVMLFAMSACSTDTKDTKSNASNGTSESTDTSAANSGSAATEAPEDFVLIKGGSFEMGSPDTEAWRSEDEIQHTVTACQRKQSGNMPVVRERQRRLTLKILSALRKRITMGIILMKLRITIFHRGTSQRNRVNIVRQPSL